MICSSRRQEDKQRGLQENKQRGLQKGRQKGMSLLGVSLALGVCTILITGYVRCVNVLDVNLGRNMYRDKCIWVAYGLADKYRYCNQKEVETGINNDKSKAIYSEYDISLQGNHICVKHKETGIVGEIETIYREGD